MRLTVWIVQHVHVQDDESEDVKFIGVYSSRAHADAAVARLSTQAGFRSQPQGFFVDPYEVDRDHWGDGYVTVETAYLRLLGVEGEVWRAVCVRDLEDGSCRVDGPYPEVEGADAQIPAGERWPVAIGDVVRCEWRPSPDGGRRLVVVGRA